MNEMEIDSNLVIWILNCLTDRRQRVWWKDTIQAGGL